MIEHDIAFVLKRFLPSKQKISILSASKGKINLSFKNKELCSKLWPGMLVWFQTQKNNFGYTCNTIDILSSPFFQTKEDLSWFHHLLELCYYFAPLDQPDQELFNYLKNYFSLLDYKHLFKKNLLTLKKLSIMHFFHLAGSQDSQQTKLINIIKNLSTKTHKHSSHIKKINQSLETITQADLKHIHKCIECGIQRHPLHRYFKTFPACLNEE